jgi:hypothetical protein
MINHHGFIYSQASITPIYRAKLEFDLDPLAERFAILNRQTLETLYTGKSDRTVLYFNQKFTSGGNLLLIILDDDKAFNAAILDGVDGLLIDVSQI